jgi:hypothetical protein
MEARRLIVAMAEKIAQGNSPFTNLRQIPSGGRTIYAVEGQGQTHYFYYTTNKTVWLAAPPGKEEAFLKDSLRQIQ